MKKTFFLIGLAFLLVLVWTSSCKSPSSVDRPSPVVTSKDSSSSNSNSNSNSGTTASMGFLQLIIRDAPVNNAEKVLITIDKIRVHQACETEDTCFFTVWENATGTEFDLLLMKDTPLIFNTTLPAGKYNQIRMSVLSGSLFLIDDPELHPLDVPSDEIKVHYQFEVPEGGTAQITLDFNAEQSLHIVKKGKKDAYLLRPVVNVVGFQQQGPGI